MRKIHKFIRHAGGTLPYAETGISENLILVREVSLAHSREIKATIYLPMTRGDSSTAVRHREYRITFLLLIFISQKRKKINTLEREQKNKPLKKLMNFKSAAHWNRENVSIAKRTFKPTSMSSSAAPHCAIRNIQFEFLIFLSMSCLERAFSAISFILIINCVVQINLFIYISFFVYFPFFLILKG